MKPAEKTLFVGLYRAMVASRSDRCNRWAVHTCEVCGEWRKVAECLMGVCPGCWERIEKEALKP